MVIMIALTPVNAVKPQKINVIIGFKGPPSPDLITQNGGNLKHTYKTINAVSAEIPVHSVSRISSSPRFEYLELDSTVKVLVETIPWGINKIGALQAHQTTTGTGVQVAVIDTGIDYTHPDLTDNYITGYDWVNDDNDPMDDHSHGTHCAGTIAALDNSIGVLGVAPTVGLYGLKAIGSTGSGYVSDIVAGIEWAVLGPDGIEGNTDDAEVISMSLGTSTGSTALKNACDMAYSKGTVVIAAAGNSGNSAGSGDTVLYPARYDSVIAVAATDSDDNRAAFSSTGSDVELSAPGVSILSTIPRDSLSYMSGTSMACPHVAGAAALLMSITPGSVSDLNGDGKWSTSEVRQRLVETATDLGSNGKDTWFGYGLVDIATAVSDATPAPPPEPEPTFDNIAVSGINTVVSATQGDVVQVTVSVENLGDVNITGLQLILRDQTDSLIVGQKTLDIESKASGSEVFIWDTSLSSIGSHRLMAYHTRTDDTAGDDTCSSEVSLTEPVSESPPEPPAPEPVYTLHVSDIDGITQNIGKGGKWRALVSICVHDQDHQPVLGAHVSVSVIAKKSSTLSGITDVDGLVTLTVSNLRDKSISLSVLDVSLEGYDYVASENYDPDLDSDGTSMTLFR
jgi:subtilisin family serine protease